MGFWRELFGCETPDLKSEMVSTPKKTPKYARWSADCGLSYEEWIESHQTISKDEWEKAWDDFYNKEKQLTEEAGRREDGAKYQVVQRPDGWWDVQQWVAYYFNDYFDRRYSGAMGLTRALPTREPKAASWYWESMLPRPPAESRFLGSTHEPGFATKTQAEKWLQNYLKPRAQATVYGPEGDEVPTSPGIEGGRS